MIKLDAHQHFWSLARGDYEWLTPDLAPIYRDFLPADLAPILQRHDIAGTVLVQAAPTAAETDYLLQLADTHDFIKGVVGWVDFTSPQAVSRLHSLAGHPRFKGVRPMVQDIPDPLWLLQPSLRPTFEALIQLDLTFDALVLCQHLQPLEQVLQRFPELRVVIDHCAKPNIAGDDYQTWAKAIKPLAQFPNTFCKISGLVTEAGPDWSVPALSPYVAHVLDLFGPQRVLWGSDWPVCTLAASYDAWLEASETLLADSGSGVFGDNALRAYRIA